MRFFILVLPGISILCFCLWFDIFVPLNQSFITIPVSNELLREFGESFDLFMPIVILLVSVFFFMTLKFKWQTVWVLITILSLYGYVPLIKTIFMSSQAFPDIVYDMVKLERPNEIVPEITTDGVRGNTYTLRRYDETAIFTTPASRSKSREIIYVQKGETITTTGRLADKGKWAEVSYKGETYWTLNPKSHDSNTWD